MSDQTLYIFLISLPSYLFMGLAIWRKFHNGDVYAGVVFSVLTLLLVSEGYFLGMTLDPVYSSPFYRICQANISALLVPMLYLFHSPELGNARVDRTTVALFALPLLILMPAMSLELVPSYAVSVYCPPVDWMGVSIFYKGKFVYHLYWIAVVLSLQSLLILQKLHRLYSSVRVHGAYYSTRAKALYYWNFSCGVILALFFYFPLAFWQQPAVRWTLYAVTAAMVAVGSCCIFLGFDINPVYDDFGHQQSLKDFMIENGDLVAAFNRLVQDEKIYLEHGIQAESVAQRLGTNAQYLERMVNAQFDCSFAEYIQQRRAEYAMELLSGTFLPLDTIASECGYEDVNSFNSLFLRITGDTPAHFRLIVPFDL